MAMVTTNRKWTIPQLVALKRESFLDLWETLPAPDFMDMSGEYGGYCIDGGDAEARRRTAESMFNESSSFGYWLGKAFKPLSAERGEGYNFCRRPGGWVQRYQRFGTAPGNSVVDGQPAYMIYYREFNNDSGKADLTDELRTLAPGLFLAVSTTRLPDGRRSQPGPFFVAGPIGPWVGPDDEEAEHK
jgi:hypothetical protein